MDGSQQSEPCDHQLLSAVQQLTGLYVQPQLTPQVSLCTAMIFPPWSRKLYV